MQCDIVRRRAISLFRTSYSFVAVSRQNVPDHLALLWFSQYAPSSSSYAPFYVSTDYVPVPYSRFPCSLAFRTGLCYD